MLLGMAETVAERGYAKTTVAAVLKRVRVSRETFYQHFSDKEACFLAVLDESARLVTGQLPTGDGGTPDEPLLARVEQVLTAYFGILTANESFARVFFVESLAAGPAAQRKRFEVQERFTDFMAAAFEEFPEWRALPDARFACRVLVGGVSSLVAAALVSGETERLPDAVPQVIALLRQLLRD